MQKKILIIENDPDSVRFLTKLIDELGYHLAGIATSEEEARRLIGSTRPNLLIIDSSLSKDIDLPETARRIRKFHNLPLIFIISSTDDQTLRTILSFGQAGYLVKPFGTNELSAAVDRALISHERDEWLKESELRFFTVLNSIGDAVFVMDRDDRITYANPVAERILEMTIDELVGRRLSEVMEIRYVDASSLDGDDQADISYTYFTSKSGRHVPIDFNISSITDISGDKIGAVIILRDDTAHINAEIGIRKSYRRIKKAVSGIIHAMAQTLETRDPYTAGHQRRVAEIARNIAIEMALSEDTIEGIFMAGLIHDLGKIAIPTEILSKPGRLSSIEMDLIRTHPQIGYDILKNLEFPWPLAEMVYQHHERQDGSGYPQGLKGDEILIGSRILCIADVVEAMASDRPYRPSLGIESTLEEIAAKSGALFDKEAASICVRLFREKNYRMQ